MTRRYFAKPKKEKSQSTLNQLRADKTTQQYAEILSWWNKTKRSRLDLSNIPEDLRSDFIRKREIYKKCNIECINRMKRSISTASERKKSALNALPPRLSFIAKISREPKWKSSLPKTVQNVYFNLHQTAKTTPSTLSSLTLDNDKFYEITKLRHKESSEIAQMEHERMHTVKQYMFPTQPLSHFPPLYDPGDIRTQSAVVRSYFDYTFKPGMEVPIKEKKTTIDPDSHLSDDEKRQVYGHDYSGVQLAKLVNVESAGKLTLSQAQTSNHSFFSQDDGIYFWCFVQVAVELVEWRI